jgi:hypothetical protein
MAGALAKKVLFVGGGPCTLVGLRRLRERLRRKISKLL